MTPRHRLTRQAVAALPVGAGRPTTDSEERIDVELFTRTLANVWEKRWGPLDGHPKDITIFGAFAEEIAAEYARIASEKDGPS